MGFWDSLCMVCGVAPSGGPETLAADWRLADDLAPVVAELRERGAAPQLTDAELLQTLADGFDASVGDGGVLPRGYGRGDYCQNYVGIGYWDGGEFCARRGGPRGRVPDGRGVGVVRLRDADGYGGKFNTVLERGADGALAAVSRRTYCDPGDAPCLFVCEHCFHFLRTWLDPQGLPPRRCAFPDDPAPLDFAGELYELANSRTRDRGFSGILPEMEYDGIEDSLDQCQEYVFPGCWKDARHTAAALAAGLRGAELLPALMRDAQAWMFMRPNIWPLPPRAECTPRFAAFPPGAPPAIARLPLELLIPLLAQLPLPAVLALSATCRSLRSLITSPALLDSVLREAILRGSLEWMRPIATMPRSENNSARRVFQRWLPREGKADAEGPTDERGDARENSGSDSGEDDEACPGTDARENSSSDSEEDDEDYDTDDGGDEADTGGADPVALLASAAFPRLAFVRACCASDSMANRRRIWGQVKRLRVLWADYRTNGWQQDVFYPAGEMGDE